MKRKLLLTLALVTTILAMGQSKSTGDKTFVTGLTANLTLNNTTSVATLVLSGPTDRWFAFKLGSFTTAMSAGVDGVYWNGTTLVDGNGGQLTTDATQNWTVTGNTVDGSTRTITATRPFNTGDANDYTIVYSSANIDIAGAYGENSGDFVLAYHGFNNKSKSVDTTFTTLGVEDFSLNASSIYPNPSDGNFTIIAKTNLSKVDVYTITGTFVKSFEVESSENKEINVSGLQSGVYLLELQNKTEKSWKKVIVN
jgi:hypothetical protein